MRPPHWSRSSSKSGPWISSSCIWAGISSIINGCGHHNLSRRDFEIRSASRLSWLIAMLRFDAAHNAFCAACLCTCMCFVSVSAPAVIVCDQCRLSCIPACIAPDSQADCHATLARFVLCLVRFMKTHRQQVLQQSSFVLQRLAQSSCLQHTTVIMLSDLEMICAPQVPAGRLPQ